MNSRLIPGLLLVIALLVSQLGAFAHGMTHAFADSKKSSEKSLLHDQYCNLCEAYAHFSSAIGSNAFSFVCSEHLAIPQAGTSSAYIAYAFVAFAARAPPSSI